MVANPEEWQHFETMVETTVGWYLEGSHSRVHHVHFKRRGKHQKNNNGDTCVRFFEASPVGVYFVSGIVPIRQYLKTYPHLFLLQCPWLTQTCSGLLPFFLMFFSFARFQPKTIVAPLFLLLFEVALEPQPQTKCVCPCFHGTRFRK